MNTRTFVFAFCLIVTAAARCKLAASDADGALNGQTIFARMEHANATRAEALAGYHVTRRYSVFEPGHPADAELVVGMEFEAPSTKTFRTIETRGVGWIERRVFRGLIAAETETATGHKHHDSDLTAANYEPTLIGTEQRDGRDYYLVAVQPKRADKYLFRGRVWIDKEDFGIARIEGEPARSPSFWIVRAPFVREYQRIDGFWLPLQDETHTNVRLAGEYVMRIQYVDYQITHRE